MARSKKKADAGIGHNSAADLPDEDFDALVLHHELSIRRAQKEADRIKAEYDEARQAVNDQFALVKADLRYSRKDFSAFMAEKDKSEAEFLADLAKKMRLYRAGGLPIAPQLDLFERNDTVDELGLAHADGLRAGRRGDDGVPTDNIHPAMHQEWLKGWTEGQGEIARKLGRAEAIIAQRGEPKNEAPADLNGGDAQLGEEIDEVAAGVEALKASGFMDGAPEAPAMEEANGGKTVRARKAA